MDQLITVYSANQMSTNPAQLAVVSRDESPIPGETPAVVVWPRTTDQIVSTVKLCAETKTPLTCRGAGSALEGSTIPCHNGLVLDVSHMTNVLDFWPEDLQVRVEPGLVYDKLNDYLKREGLFFPPSPGGPGDSATIG